MSATAQREYDLHDRVLVKVDDEEIEVTIRTRDDEGYVITPPGGGQRKVQRGDIIRRVEDLASLDTPLSVDEDAELERRETACRKAIERAENAFGDLGDELAEIRDKELYRKRHRSWEAYVGETFKLSRTYSLALIDFARGRKLMSARADTRPLDNPRQWRELKAAGEEAPVAWDLAVGMAEGAAPTVQQVRTSVDQVTGRGREVWWTDPDGRVRLGQIVAARPDDYVLISPRDGGGPDTITRRRGALGEGPLPEPPFPFGKCAGCRLPLLNRSEGAIGNCTQCLERAEAERAAQEATEREAAERAAQQPPEPVLPTPAPHMLVGVRFNWRDPVSFRGRTGILTGVDVEGLAILETDDGFQPNEINVAVAELAQRGFRRADAILAGGAGEAEGAEGDGDDLEWVNAPGPGPIVDLDLTTTEIAVPAELLRYGKGDQKGAFLQSLDAQPRPSLSAVDVAIWDGDWYALFTSEGDPRTGTHAVSVSGFRLVEQDEYEADALTPLHSRPEWTPGRLVRCEGLEYVLGQPVRFVPQVEEPSAEPEPEQPTVTSAPEVPQPTPTPEPAPEPDPVTAMIPAALNDRLAELGGGILPAVRTYISLAEVAEEHDLDVTTAVQVLKRYLACCGQLGMSFDGQLTEWEASIESMDEEDLSRGE